jgi:sialic acid synthase SpsE
MKIIVDLFNQHSGDIDELMRLALSAFSNGADIVKIQIIDSKRIWGDDSRKYLEMDFNEVKKIHDYCRTIGVEFMVTIFNEKHIEWLDKLDIKRYKIASVTSKYKTKSPEGDKILCDELLSKDKETYISLGFAEKDEFPFGFKENIKYLFCVPKYPTPLYDKDLRNMPLEFSRNGYCGFSDHALGISAAIQSYIRGAEVLEKHFTFNNFQQGSTEKAHLCSFTPESLRQFRNLINEFKVLNGC